VTTEASYRIRHETTYEYAQDVVHAHQLLHLEPRPAAHQQCLEQRLHIAPEPARLQRELDAFGNFVTRVEFDRPHRRLEVVSELAAAVHARPLPDAADSSPWEAVAATLDYPGLAARGLAPGAESLEACRFRHESPHVRIKRLFTEYGADCFPAGRPILAAAVALMSRLHADLEYAPGATTIATPLLQVLERRRGVCQDFAHLMIACLRSRGLAARYVSGYLRPLPHAALPTATPPEGASHAWVAVHAPPFGWVELDPTNDRIVGTDHVAIAFGRDFADVSPLRGVIQGGGAHTLRVSVRVEPLGIAAGSQGIER
jgi:transglutaminase-like putative cysteine protease